MVAAGPSRSTAAVALALRAARAVSSLEKPLVTSSVLSWSDNASIDGADPTVPASAATNAPVNDAAVCKSLQPPPPPPLASLLGMAVLVVLFSADTDAGGSASAADAAGAETSVGQPSASTSLPSSESDSKDNIRPADALLIPPPSVPPPKPSASSSSSSLPIAWNMPSRATAAAELTPV